MCFTEFVPTMGHTYAYARKTYMRMGINSDCVLCSLRSMYLSGRDSGTNSLSIILSSTYRGTNSLFSGTGRDKPRVAFFNHLFLRRFFVPPCSLQGGLQVLPLSGFPLHILPATANPARPHGHWPHGHWPHMCALLHHAQQPFDYRMWH